LHIADTAGLRESPDQVEQIGIERAWQEIEQADRILLVVDANQNTAIDIGQLWPESINKIDPHKIILIRNKIDLSQEKTGLTKTENGYEYLNISAKHHQGIDDLRSYLKSIMGFQQTNESGFTARRRHLDALQRAYDFIQQGKIQLQTFAAGELLAEDLRQAQNALNEITGEFTPDDLLGRIFSSFCIGK
jgi:tRNA modification GTPase